MTVLTYGPVERGGGGVVSFGRRKWSVAEPVDLGERGSRLTYLGRMRRGFMYVYFFVIRKCVIPCFYNPSSPSSLHSEARYIGMLAIGVLNKFTISFQTLSSIVANTCTKAGKASTVNFTTRV